MDGMEIDGKIGVASALAAAISENQAEDAAAQLSLLPDTGESFSTEPRGVGRPAGSKNKSTEYWRQKVFAKHKSPLMFLGEIWAMPVEDMVKQHGVKREDALKLKVSCAAAALPYMHQKQAMAVDVDNRSRVLISVVDPNKAITQDKIDSGEAKALIKADYCEFEEIEEDAENEEV